MTTIKDPIRQASLFTPFGLIDPRLMPGFEEKKVELKKTSQSKTEISLKEIIANLFRSKFGYQ